MKDETTHLAKYIHDVTLRTTAVWCSEWGGPDTDDPDEATCAACLEAAATFGEKCRTTLVALNAAREGILTVDTITDAQIRELHRFSMKQIRDSEPYAEDLRAHQEAWLKCEIALEGDTVVTRRLARAVCAQILNEYVRRAKDAGGGTP